MDEATTKRIEGRRGEKTRKRALAPRGTTVFSFVPSVFLAFFSGLC